MSFRRPFRLSANKPLCLRQAAHIRQSSSMTATMQTAAAMKNTFTAVASSSSRLRPNRAANRATKSKTAEKSSANRVRKAFFRLLGQIEIDDLKPQQKQVNPLVQQCFRMFDFLFDAHFSSLMQRGRLKKPLPNNAGVFRRPDSNRYQRRFSNTPTTNPASAAKPMA